MTPRLLSSKKWTNFPSDYLGQIREVFTSNFQEILSKIGKAQGKEVAWVTEGRIYPEEILLRVGYRIEGRLLQNNFEASQTYKDDKAVQSIYNCIDALATLMSEHFEKISDEDFELPREWQEIEFEGQTMCVRYSTVNSDLEAEADKLLGELGEGLVQGELNEDFESELVPELVTTEEDEH